jgi:hypothetical protein
MKSDKTECIQSDARPPALADTPLAKGQKWRIPRGDAEILHIGKTLIQYRFIKTGMVRGPLEMKSIASFIEALKTHDAELVS